MHIVLMTFVLVAGIVLGCYWLFVVSVEERASRHLQQKLKVGKTRKAARQDLFRPEQQLSTVSGLNRLLLRTDFIVGPVRRQIQRAGFKVTVGMVLLSSLFLASITGAAAYFLTSLAAIAFLAGVIASAAPFLFVRYKASRRLRQFEEQFPEALDLIARALRAGHAFTTGLGMAADEIPSPVGAEFRLIHDRQNYGMPLAEALHDFGDRVPLLDARFFATAVLTQRESGGNLAEVLDNLAALIRERFKVKRQVRTVSAHGRITGWVLAFLAPTLAAILTAIAPEHMALMIQDPLGIRMIVGTVVLQTIGVFAIRRIVNIEV